MKKCEYCNKEHEGIYASGRFCSEKCARGFSTSKNKLKKKKVICKKCGRKYLTHLHSRINNFICHECHYILCSICGKACTINFKPKYGFCQTCLQKHEIYSKIISDATKDKNGGYREKSGRGKQGRYKNYWCQSTWELAFVIYHLDHNIKFKRNKQGFPYKFEGKTYKYYPDFIKNNCYYEVKGYETKQTLAKYKAINNLRVLKQKEIEPYIEYVKVTYKVQKLEELYEQKEE